MATLQTFVDLAAGNDYPLPDTTDTTLVPTTTSTRQVVCQTPSPDPVSSNRWMEGYPPAQNVRTNDNNFNNNKSSLQWPNLLGGQW